MTVKVERLEQQVREALATSASRDARVTELTRQLDAHRQEHARQAATIVTLRQKLQVGDTGNADYSIGGDDGNNNEKSRYLPTNALQESTERSDNKVFYSLLRRKRRVLWSP